MHGPWVGSIDLDEIPQLKTKMFQAEGGYRVPPKGQVHLTIKNQLGTVMKMLVVPYDLKDMPPGTQAPIRRIWYGEAPIDPQLEAAAALEHPEKELTGKEVIRYAVHMKFVCPAVYPQQRPRARSAGQTITGRAGFSKFGMTSMTSANVESQAVDDDGDLSSHSAGETTVPKKKYVRSASSIDPRKIYLAGEMRIVFASRIPDEEEAVRAETEEGHAEDKYFNWDGPQPNPARSPPRS